MIFNEFRIPEWLYWYIGNMKKICRTSSEHLLLQETAFFGILEWKPQLDWTKTLICNAGRRWYKYILSIYLCSTKRNQSRLWQIVLTGDSHPQLDGTSDGGQLLIFDGLAIRWIVSTHPTVWFHGRQFQSKSNKKQKKQKTFAKHFDEKIEISKLPADLPQRGRRAHQNIELPASTVGPPFLVG